MSKLSIVIGIGFAWMIAIMIGICVILKTFPPTIELAFIIIPAIIFYGGMSCLTFIIIGIGWAIFTDPHFN